MHSPAAPARFFPALDSRVVARLFWWLAAASCLVSAAFAETTGRGGSPDSEPRIPTWQARPGRIQPVVAIVGENSGTELSDFVIPYGVLARSGSARVVTVSTQAGILRMRPALQLQADATISEFDERFADGADYVIVPAVVRYKDPALLSWIKSQAEKGASIMSVCDGAAVVAGTGLMDGRRATAHWASARNRRRLFPEVQWIADARYVTDGKIISTAGISAALPASLALVEAIAGSQRALELARELGVTEWTPTHRTAEFRPRLGVNVKAHLAVNYTNAWFHSTDMIGLTIAEGVDEIALAITADAYSRTGRSMLHALNASPDPVRTRSGLLIVPDSLPAAHRLDLQLPQLDATPSAEWFAKSLDGIRKLYGAKTAYGVALNLEYPLASGGRPRALTTEHP